MRNFFPEAKQQNSLVRSLACSSNRQSKTIVSAEEIVRDGGPGPFLAPCLQENPLPTGWPACRAVGRTILRLPRGTATSRSSLIQVPDRNVTEQASVQDADLLQFAPVVGGPMTLSSHLEAWLFERYPEATRVPKGGALREDVDVAWAMQACIHTAAKYL